MGAFLALALGFGSTALKNWKLILIAAMVAAIPVTYLIAHSKGKTAGYQQRIAEVAKADAKAELERKKDDVKLKSMSDYDLCVYGLRDSRLSDDACEQLRGVSGE